MAISLGWGFFDRFWLGAKQAIMLLILADLVYMIPVFVATAKATSELSEPGGALLEQTRSLLARVDKHVVPMRMAAVVAVILAIWRPEL